MVNNDLANDDLSEIIDRFKIFEKMYNTMRIVDPLCKRVVEVKNGAIQDTKNHCFLFWDKYASCENCISMRSLNENDTFVKIEYSPNEIFMVSAIPIVINEKNYVVEILKDVTRSMLFSHSGENDSQEMITMINDLHTAIIKDGLTAIYNKRFVNERLPAEVIKSSIEAKSLAVVLGDIDRFKYINDKYGHVGGDYVLKNIATILNSSIDKNQGWVARYGGEEFLICLLNTDKCMATNFAERTRELIEKTEIAYNNDIIRTTISFGVCELAEVNPPTMEAIIYCADARLYQAKKTGRNKVVNEGPELI